MSHSADPPHPLPKRDSFDAVLADEDEQDALVGARGASLDHTGGDIATPSKAQVKRILAQKLLVNTLLVISWFTLSMALSLYNKWMFSKHPNNNGRDNLNFPFPLFTTSLHMVVQFLGSWAVLQLMPRFRTPHDHRVTAKDYATRIGPCGVATGLDIGFSNASLKTITLAFYTMCKSSSLAFVLLFAFLFKLEKLRVSLVCVIGIITVGVVLMVAHETRFVLEGFLLVMTASCLGGLRWALTQILLKENPSTSNPFSSIFHLAPIMFVSLLTVAMILEGPVALVNAELWQARGIWALPILLFPGLLAFLMTASEFGLIQRTSVVTLSVAGILKEVLTIGASAVMYGDALTLLNVSGLLVTIVGIALYNVLRFRSMRKKVKQAVSGDRKGIAAESVPLRSETSDEMNELEAEDAIYSAARHHDR
jgi:solute carrier family 35 protein C2